MKKQKAPYNVSSAQYSRISAQPDPKGYLSESADGLKQLYWRMPSETVLHEIYFEEGDPSEWRYKRDRNSQKIRREAETGELFLLDLARCENLKYWLTNQCNWGAGEDFGPGICIVADPAYETYWAVTQGEDDQSPESPEARQWGWGYLWPKLEELYSPIERRRLQPAAEQDADRIAQYIRETRSIELSAEVLQGERGKPGFRSEIRAELLADEDSDWTSGRFKKAWEALQDRYGVPKRKNSEK